MTNYEAIGEMTKEQLVNLLEEVYTAGQNSDDNSFNLEWLDLEAEETESAVEATKETTSTATIRITLGGGSGLKVEMKRENAEDILDNMDLDGLEIKQLKSRMQDIMDDLDVLKSLEPKDTESEEYELWVEAMEELEDTLDEFEDIIDDLRG